MTALTLLTEQPLLNPSTKPRPAPCGRPAPGSVRRAIEFIHAHADSDIGLGDIAAAACTSARSLLRHFKLHLATTPMACLRTVRLERARRDIQAGNGDTVRDIAWRWGFENPSKFSRAYRSHFGELPGRRRHAR